MNTFEFREWLEMVAPGLISSFEVFPSGAFIATFVAGNREFFIEWLPTLNAYGLSERKQDDPGFGWQGVDNSFDSKEELGHAIHDLIRATTSG